MFPWEKPNPWPSNNKESLWWPVNSIGLYLNFISSHIAFIFYCCYKKLPQTLSLIILQVCSLLRSLTRVSVGYHQGFGRSVFLSKDSREEFIFWLFPASKNLLHSQTHGPLPPFQNQQNSVVSASLRIFLHTHHLPLTTTRKSLILRNPVIR